MPVRFACQQCGQPFQVSSGKAGLRLKCPRCAASLVVPDEQPAYVPLELPAVDTSSPTADAAPGQLPVDGRWVAVPRRVIYGQGILLGLVGITAFVLGFMFARSWPGPDDAGSESVRGPCTVRGTVTYSAGDGQIVPDAGCLALAVPVDILPDEKLPIDGLGPGNPDLPSQHPTRQALRALGGAVGRADQQGQFQIRLPRTGDYFLLLISAAGQVPRDNLPERKDLAQLGRYVTSAHELLGSRRYVWRQLTVSSDTRHDWEFGPASN